MQAAETTREAALAERYPTLALEGRLRANGVNPAQLHDDLRVHRLGKSQHFRRRPHSRRYGASRREIRQRKDELADAGTAHRCRYRSALLDLKSAADQVAVARDNLELANQTLTQARDRFAAGVTDNIEVVQAQDAVANAQEALIASMYAHNLAKVSLARAVGMTEASLKQFMGGKRGRTKLNEEDYTDADMYCVSRWWSVRRQLRIVASESCRRRKPPTTRKSTDNVDRDQRPHRRACHATCWWRTNRFVQHRRRAGEAGSGRIMKWRWPRRESRSELTRRRTCRRRATDVPLTAATTGSTLKRRAVTRQEAAGAIKYASSSRIVAHGPLERWRRPMSAWPKPTRPRPRRMSRAIRRWSPRMRSPSSNTTRRWLRAEAAKATRGRAEGRGGRSAAEGSPRPEEAVEQARAKVGQADERGAESAHDRAATGDDDASRGAVRAKPKVAQQQR